MAKFILSTDVNPFLVPAECGMDIGCAVSQSQAAATAVRIVGLGAVQQEIAVNRYLSCFEFIDNDFAILFWIIDGLIEDVVISR